MATVFLFVSLILISHYRSEGTTTIDPNVRIETNYSITTTDGQIYDCVDFYKQPAFRNPLLNNLITSKALESKSIARAHTRKAPLSIGLKDGGCPYGSVPILRTNKYGENDHQLHSNVPSQELISPQGDPQEPDHCYAIVRTNDPNKHYNGVRGQLVVYNPSTQDTQWSAARMRLSNGQDSIEAGYMVNPSLFNDDKTHLYMRYMAGGKGCFNLQCPGFVHVGKEVPIGVIAKEISVRGGDQVFWTLSIDKHNDGNWWLSIGPTKYEIGYWPKTLFSSLVDVANQVEWGGEVYNPPSKDKYPQMGCGYKPNYDTRLAALISNATIVDEGFHVGAPPKDTVKYENCIGLYEAQDAGDKGGYWGRIIFFGGPKDP